MNRTALLLGSVLGLAAMLCAIFIRQKLQHDEYRQGEVYSVEDEKGYRIAKILAVDSRAVHIRLYKNVFSGRPVNIDFKSLTLGSINDPDGFGVGHLPVTPGTFSSWHPVLIARTAVSQEELEGYEEWKKSKGGAFGETN
jgi:hypothetical protein